MDRNLDVAKFFRFIACTLSKDCALASSFAMLLLCSAAMVQPAVAQPVNLDPAPETAGSAAQTYARTAWQTRLVSRNCRRPAVTPRLTPLKRGAKSPVQTRPHTNGSNRS
jgi:hypothetical protein